MTDKAGKTLCQREDSTHKISFGILQKNLPELTRDLSFLHVIEKETLSKLIHSKRISSYLLGRYVAKIAIAKLIQEKELSHILIEHGVFKFPIVKYPFNENIQVSISHCENIGVALAYFESHPVSIDIEKIDDSNSESLKSQVSSSELQITTSLGLSIPKSLTLCWTIKEALSKIIRTGLMTSFTLFEITSIEVDDGLLISEFKNFPQYKSISKVLGNYVCSAIIPRKSECYFQDMFNQFDFTINHQQ